jgi:hypothetical protein
MAETSLPKLIGLAFLALALAGVWQAMGTIQRDITFTAAQTEVSFWGREQYQPTAATIERTGALIGKLTRRPNSHPEHLALQGAYASWRSYWAEDSSARSEFATLAVNSQFRALESRPGHRHGWAKMVEYSSRDAQGAARLEQAQARFEALQLTR